MTQSAKKSVFVKKRKYIYQWIAKEKTGPYIMTRGGHRYFF